MAISLLRRESSKKKIFDNVEATQKTKLDSFGKTGREETITRDVTS